MLLVCLLQFAIGHNPAVIVTQFVPGKLINQNEQYFLVDFSEYISYFDLTGDAKNYSNIMKDKRLCIKVTQQDVDKWKEVHKK